MWLLSSWHAIALSILFYTPRVHVYRSRDLPTCSKCSNVMGDIGSVIKAFMGHMNVALRKMCQNDEKSEKAYLATKEIVNKYITKVADSVFPEVAAESTRIMTCSHILFMCPDETQKGRELPANVWSCNSCTAFLDLVLTFFKDPLTDLNQLLPSVFCKSDDKDCIVEFETALNITGALGQFLEGKRDASSVCRVTMDCDGDKQRRIEW